MYYSAKKGGGAPKGILSTHTSVRNVQTFMLFLNTTMSTIHEFVQNNEYERN